MKINEGNLRETLISYLEGELNPKERKDVEGYLLHHAYAAEEWHRLRATQLRPDTNVVMPNKARLYRREEEEHVHIAQPAPVRKLYWYVASAAAVAAALIMALFLLPSKQAAITNLTAESHRHVTHVVTGTESKKDEQINKSNSVYELLNSEVNVAPVIKELAKSPSHHSMYRRPAIPLEIDNKEQLASVASIQKVEVLPARVPSSMSQFINEGVTVKTLAVYKSKPRLQEEKEAEKPDQALLWKAIGFFKKSVHIQRQTINDANYIALGFETEKIKIDRKFKVDF